MEPSASPAVPAWLADLESRIGQAVAEIDRLRQENRRLEKELSRLRRTKTSEGAASALTIWRMAMRALAYELRRRGGYTRSVAIAGATEIALSLAKTITEEPFSGGALGRFSTCRL